MREEKLLDFIGQIDSQYIEEARSIPKSAKLHLFRWCSLAACLALCLWGAFLGHSAYQQYHTEVSYICFDVNPSFEFCLNHKNMVINAIAYNEDGEALLQQVDYRNRYYEDVVTDILHHEAIKPHLTTDLTITIVTEDKTEIQQRIQAHMEETECGGRVLRSDSHTRDQARENHCSVGKYVAYTNLAQYDTDVTLEDCKGMKMHEIYAEIEKHHSEHPSSQAGTAKTDCGSNHSTHHSNHH